MSSKILTSNAKHNSLSARKESMAGVVILSDPQFLGPTD